MLNTMARTRKTDPIDPADDLTNEPEDIAGKSPGAQVSQSEAQVRRAAIDLLLIDGHPDADIIETMTGEFGMTRQHAHESLKAAKVRLQKHCDDRKPLNRAAAERRLHQHIAAARKKNQFTAVAQLEKQLSAIQGTEQPPKIEVNVNARLTQAVLHVLGGMEPAQIQTIVADEAARLPPGK